jgi:hypothetical protein
MPLTSITPSFLKLRSSRPEPHHAVQLQNDLTQAIEIMRVARTTILLTQLLLGFSRAQKRCYYPNGEWSEKDFPCDPDAETSVCCWGLPGVACLSNKLCVNPNGSIVRGSCTDQSWLSGDCPQYCQRKLYSCSNFLSDVFSDEK